MHGFSFDLETQLFKKVTWDIKKYFQESEKGQNQRNFDVWVDFKFYIALDVLAILDTTTMTFSIQ